MDTLLYLAGRSLVAVIHWLPLRLGAFLGRMGGGVAWAFDRRHRRVAEENIARCLGPDLDARAVRELARENFRRLGENMVAGIKLAALDARTLAGVYEVRGLEKLTPFMEPGADGVRPNLLLAIGHFGSFELFAHVFAHVPDYRLATTYRALGQPGLNRVFQAVREKSGCRFFERRTEGGALRAHLSQGGVLLGLLSDQHGGSRGVWGPFLGRECSTSPATALFALRYQCNLFTAICYRIRLGRWRIEVGDRIPTRDDVGRPRPVEAITREVNRAFEEAVRRDPANWFWVHRRWKVRDE